MKKILLVVTIAFLVLAIFGCQNHYLDNSVDNLADVHVVTFLDVAFNVVPNDDHDGFDHVSDDHHWRTGRSL
ncbi:MAG: hypothetical protein MZU97_26335 [Bacillus subtilis]|nr:hypothetical protein [Bacillus subtilis]